LEVKASKSFQNSREFHAEKNAPHDALTVDDSRGSFVPDSISASSPSQSHVTNQVKGLIAG
jgi:hypothetical protein